MFDRFRKPAIGNRQMTTHILPGLKIMTWKILLQLFFNPQLKLKKRGLI